MEALKEEEFELQQKLEKLGATQAAAAATPSADIPPVLLTFFLCLLIIIIKQNKKGSTPPEHSIGRFSAFPSFKP